MSMKLLDLYCCAGGAAKGYADAGFTVTGVDLSPQPRYPYSFIHGDALAYLAAHGHEYDAIHASPPCQAYTRLRGLQGDKEYPDLVAATRDLLREIGVPYVIENVPGAPLIDPIVLCGSMFGLRVYRHRLFESSLPLVAPVHPKHEGRASGTKGGSWADRLNAPILTITGGNFRTRDGREAMETGWMNHHELTQAIPPAYTRYIGSQLMKIL